MQELHQETNYWIGGLLGRLEKEENRQGQNPIFTVIEEALHLMREASTNGLEFPSYGDVLATLEDRLGEVNSPDYEDQERDHLDLKDWIAQF